MVGRAGGAPRRAVPRRQQHRGARAHLPRAPPAPHYLVSPCIPFPCAASFCACGRSIILLACAQGCSRPRLVIFEKTAPDEIATVNTSFERVPDHWIHPDGNINFCVSRGTLIPAADRKKPPMETADRAIAMIPQAAGLSRGPARVVAARPATPPLMPGGPPPLGLGHTPPLPPYANGMPGMQNGGLPPGMGYPNGMMGKYNPYAAQMYANGLAGGQLNGMGGPHHAPPQQAMPAHGFNNTRLPMSQPAQMANAIMTSNAMSALAPLQELDQACRSEIEARVKSVLDAGAGQPAQFSNVIECFHFSDRTTLSGKNCDLLFIVLIIFNYCILLLPSGGRQQRCMQLEQRSALRGHHRETGAVPF